MIISDKCTPKQKIPAERNVKTGTKYCAYIPHLTKPTASSASQAGDVKENKLHKNEIN